MKKIIFLIVFSLIFIMGCNQSKISKTVKTKITKGDNYITLSIENLSKTEVVEIVWDKSRIGDSPCFLKGKYIDAGKSQLNDVLAPEQFGIYLIYPSDNVYYEETKYSYGQVIKKGGWEIRDIIYPIKFVLCLKIGDKEEFIMEEVSNEK